MSTIHLRQLMRLTSPKPVNRRPFSSGWADKGDSFWNKHGSTIIAYGTPGIFAIGLYKYVFAKPANRVKLTPIEKKEK